MALLPFLVPSSLLDTHSPYSNQYPALFTLLH